MKAGTSFSARVLIFSAISGLMLTNLNLLSADKPSVKVNSKKVQSKKPARNPQSTLLDAIQREMHSARRGTKPRAIFPKQEKKNTQIQQVGLTLNPKSLFQKRSTGSTKKKPEQKRPVIVRGGQKPTAANPQYQTAVPRPNARSGQSEIQRQLEALYRRDGRVMPPMQLNALPQTAGANSGSGRGVINQSQPSNVQTTPQNIVKTPSQNRFQQPSEQRKWYEKFLPRKSNQTPKRLQQSSQIVKKAPLSSPVTKKPVSPAQPQLPAAPAPETQTVVTTPQKPAENKASVANTVAPSTEKLSDEELEEAANGLEEQKIAETKETDETQFAEEITTETSPENVVLEDEFKNLFPDMSEEAADNFVKPKAEKKEKEAVKTPFSGLVLEEEGLKKSDEKQKTKTTTPEKEATPQIAKEEPKKEFNPFEPQTTPVIEPEKKTSSDKKVVKKELELPEENPFKPQPEQKKKTQPAPIPASKIATSDYHDPIEKKLALIASRGNIKGLKGFCPVALRENRLLVDARPEFSSSFKSMNYQFASLENKVKFDREPAKYAPAAGGSDIVLLVDHQDDKEGTLDFASWYKGRLYLFSSKSNMDLFMKTPALYVGVE
ncbi:hypothetical protein [Gimesia aquarii]|uniref:YHS domain protein n=1 Tax=Gimesia aquarii TaxID=2527964 RepID=A0A517W275_9PLAN|nr:hypothetical protein [Gimesia aquarii]QDT99358.1 YHS domain protein [Gimesia aquarii]